MTSLSPNANISNIASLYQPASRKNLRYNDADFILFAFHGDLDRIKSAMEKNDLPELLATRGFAQNLTLNLSNGSSKFDSVSSSTSYAGEILEK